MKVKEVGEFVQDCIDKGVKVPEGLIFPVTDYFEHVDIKQNKAQCVYDFLGGAIKIIIRPENHLSKILNEVALECAKQDVKWGPSRTHHPLVWNTILGEERGEVEKEINESNFSDVQGLNYEIEYTQVAAVAVQAINSNQLVKFDYAAQSLKEK